MTTRAAFLFVLLATASCKHGTCRPDPPAKTPVNLEAAPTQPSDGLDTDGATRVAVEAATTPEEIYPRWLALRDRRFAQGLQEGGDPSIFRDQLAWLPGVEWAWGAGSFEGGHEFYDPVWMWQREGRWWIYASSIGEEKVDEAGLHYRVSDFVGCTLEGKIREAALRKSDGTFAVPWDEFEARRAAIRATTCEDVGPILRAAFFDGSTKDEKDRVAELARWLLTIRFGGERSRVLESPAELDGYEYLRMHQKTAVRPPKLTTLPDGYRLQAVAAISMPGSDTFITVFSLEITADKLVLDVEWVGTDEYPIE
jgi:hypothetical protein